VEKNVKLS